MLSRFFHAWEHRLASVSTDRVVRPFEWGTDWLAHANGHAPEDRTNVGSDGVGRSFRSADQAPDDRERVRLWIDSAMADTPAFFDLPEIDTFEFTEADAGTREKGEAGTLRYASALTTPHPENNVVTARWFPASGEWDRTPRPSRSRAVVILPQWNSDAGGHIGLARLLARCGVSSLRMSLPYHDARMPPELTRADYIVSSNIVRTVQVCRQAVLDARRAVSWLEQQGFERIGILGTSLGSCLAMLTAAHEPRIRAQALNHVSPWFADVVWRGLSTRHVRQGLEGHVDLETLRDLWRPISPFSYLDRIQNTQTLLVYALYDLTFPLDLSTRLVEEFRARSLPHEVAVLRCGHYSTGVAPFKFIDAYALVRFLRKAL
jgi:hypothetical protein